MEMQKSDSIQAITSALIGFHSMVPTIDKDGHNPYYKSKFATLSNILKKIKDPLIKNNLTFVQFPVGESAITTLIMHSSGEFIGSTYAMHPKTSDPQGIGSAITYQRRYALAAALGLDIDDDDDGNVASDTPRREAAKEAMKAPNVTHDDVMVNASYINEIAPKVFKSQSYFIDFLRLNYKVNDASKLTRPQMREVLDAIENAIKKNHTLQVNPGLGNRIEGSSNISSTAQKRQPPVH